MTNRKTVSELTRIKEDVFVTMEQLHNCLEDLENLSFDLTRLPLDDIRTDEDGYHTDLIKSIRALIRRVNKTQIEHTKAVKKYREFFCC